MRRELLIEPGLVETRVALIEDERLAELHIEPALRPKLNCSIWFGRVRRIVPAMQAAFIDIGLEHEGFLNRADLPGPAGTPIERLLHEGQAIIVQAIREPIGEKGVKLSAGLNLAGRYLVLTPQKPGVNISRRISDAALRSGFDQALSRLLPDMGCIVRTAATLLPPDHAAAAFAAELGHLRARWAAIQDAAAKAEAPALLWQDASAVTRALRDLATPDLARIAIDDAGGFAAARAWLTDYAPDLLPRLERFTGPGALFAQHDAEQDSAEALGPRLELAQGGSITFAETEALTAVDVDAGGFTSGQDRDATLLRLNLNAAAEIARQIRLRAIGGLIVIDFVHMEPAAHRQQVVAALRNAFRHDPAPVRVLDMSDLGLVEMVRKRSGETLAALCLEPERERAPRIDHVLARLCRQAQAEIAARPAGRLAIACAPELAAALDGELLARLGARLGTLIELRPEPDRTRADFGLVLG